MNGKYREQDVKNTFSLERFHCRGDFPRNNVSSMLKVGLYS